MCSDQENHKQKGVKCAGHKRKSEAPGHADTAGPARRGPMAVSRAPGARSTKPTVEEETYRVLSRSTGT